MVGVVCGKQQGFITYWLKTLKFPSAYRIFQNSFEKIEHEFNIYTFCLIVSGLVCIIQGINTCAWISLTRKGTKRLVYLLLFCAEPQFVTFKILSPSLKKKEEEKGRWAECQKDCIRAAYREGKRTCSRGLWFLHECSRADCSGVLGNHLLFTVSLVSRL